MWLNCFTSICVLSAFLAGDGVAAAPLAPDCDQLFGCPSDGATYRDSILEALDRSDRIEVTEHSDPFDLVTADDLKIRVNPEVVYRRVELAREQIAYFRRALQDMDVTTQNWATACMPNFHHTIRFWRGDESLGELVVCFGCGHLKWDRSRVSPPGAIYKTLANVVTHAGLSPKREWRQLASEATAKNKGR
jgi:hypothetical protein